MARRPRKSTKYTYFVGRKWHYLLSLLKSILHKSSLEKCLTCNKKYLSLPEIKVLKLKKDGLLFFLVFHPLHFFSDFQYFCFTLKFCMFNSQFFFGATKKGKTNNANKKKDTQKKLFTSHDDKKTRLLISNANFH